MSRRRKWKPDIVVRLERIRTALAHKYGNLHGIKLSRWFWFNGETAVPRGGHPSERKETLRRFEERLAAHQNSQGSSALNRERRKARQRAEAA